jgi:GT2 family glycosyltransferase
MTCLADGVLAYHLFLGRAPENEDVARALLDAPFEDVAVGFLGSEEFRSRILIPIGQRGYPTDWEDHFPPHTLDAPLARALRLDRETALAARDWAELLGVVFQAPVARQALVQLHGDAAEPVLSLTDSALMALRERSAAQAQAFERIRSAARGLEVVSIRDIVGVEGRLQSVSDDPSILLVVEPLAAGPLLHRLTVGIKHPAGRPGMTKLYFDLGQGYQEATALSGEPGAGKNHFLLAPSDALRTIRLDPVDVQGVFDINELTLAPVEDAVALRDLVASSTMDAREAFYRSRAVSRLLDGLGGESEGPLVELNLSREFSSFLVANPQANDYARWLDRYERPFAADYARMAEMAAAFERKPSFSFVVPIYNTPVGLLADCLTSLLDQNYPYFNICVADDNSSDSRAADYVEALAARDPRVRFVRRQTNGHISEASNSALDLADGDYIVLVDHDDIVPDYCLFVLAAAINRQPNAKVLFSDEDKLDEFGERCSPYFKSDLNSFLLFGQNMVSHLGVYETALVREVGGFRKGFEGSQDWDLALRCIEAAGADAVVLIPHVLYHWRMIAGSTAVAIDEKSYAADAGTAAVQDHFRRTGLPLAAEPGVVPGLSRVETPVVPDTLVSILIPTRDGLDLLRPCIDSVRRCSTGRFEIVVLDNGSERQETHDYFELLHREGWAEVVAWPEPFNFSAINNFGVQHCAGEIVCFLNNDTEVVSEAWLDRARGLLAISEVGAVGARLLYPDGALQHMGVVLGMGAHGVAGTPHGGLDGRDPGYFNKARLLAEFSAVTAACLFVRRSDFLAVGGFEPGLAVAYNDIDLCLKLRRLKLKVLCDPEITLIHKESRTRGYDTTSERAKRLQREADTMLSRWKDELENDPYFSPNLSLMSASFDLAWPPRRPMPWLPLADVR